MRARVFISCGQSDESERTVAHGIFERLDNLGYEPYLAVEEQTLNGLVENIFGRLAASEYLVFVDFLREQFANQPEHRGSLFSHQELAVAAYLRLEVVAIQEAGVRQLDGMIRFVQANATVFSDRKKVPELVEQVINRNSWQPSWRRTLALKRQPNQFIDVPCVDIEHRPAGHRRFFLATIHNQHISRVAAHAYVYLDQIKRIGESAELPLSTIELKWSGYMLPFAVLRPGAKREFDCCWIHHNEPSVARFDNPFGDSPVPTKLVGPGKFQLKYSVVADGFAPESIDMMLTLGTCLDDAHLVPA
jgi:hypothetical protein